MNGLPPEQYQGYWRCEHHPHALLNFFEGRTECVWECHTQELRRYHNGTHPAPERVADLPVHISGNIAVILNQTDPMQNMNPARAGAGEMPPIAQPAPQMGTIANRLAPQINTNRAVAGAGEPVPGARPF